jgi:glycine dehydrogenase subunit 2
MLEQLNSDKVLIFDHSVSGRRAMEFPELDVPEAKLPTEFMRAKPAAFPEVSQMDLVRHYTKLSQMNFSIDTVFYPLGSCTMKYNPKINETIAALPGLMGLHPWQDVDQIQGMLAMLYQFQENFKEIFGFDAVTLQPLAGSQGEYCGLLLIKKYLEDQGQTQRKLILVPDSAHGTNPASVTMAGFQIQSIKSNARGGMDLEDLKKHLSDKVAGLMLTNPNTLGLFDEDILEVAKLVHAAGGLLYYDGANANAIMGLSRPGDFGFDVAHINTHKTFSTPHGGGGPGAGPVGVKARLAKYLPAPRVILKDGKYAWEQIPEEQTIGKLAGFWGNVGVLVRAWAYIYAYGGEGLKQVSEKAVLNANYIKAKLTGVYDFPFDRFCKHEFVISCSKFKKEYGVTAIDIAKRLIDYGVHPPTMYFPLIVPECLMIEPTETESKETLDAFCDIMLKIADEAKTNPELLKSAPHHTPVRRLDEATAARNPELCFRCS